MHTNKIILAFESSCDDTSVSLLRGHEVLSMHTYTQIEHKKTQWVVPEIAARLHANKVFEMLQNCLDEAQMALDDIHEIACTSEPWLMPSLLVGKTVAQTLEKTTWIPVQWVNHVEWHIFSVLLERRLEDIVFPSVVLSASGGHNDLFVWRSINDFERIGGTRDDSAGESMDKIGREMWLPFPAGRYIDEAATQHRKIHGEHREGMFPTVELQSGYEFSFSWLKSAAIRYIRAREHELNEEEIAFIAHEYLEAICESLMKKYLWLADEYEAKQLILVGGVSANARLRELLARSSDLPILTPTKLAYCGDNAAMIGVRAQYL